jgi:FkbM family methyltransferase
MRRMLAQFRRRITRHLKRRFYRPYIKVEPLEGLITLGSSYGSWTFQPSSVLDGATIISCGLGEDASFDVEFASRFGGRVIIVDPTPKAIRHFACLSKRIGLAAESRFPAGGRMPVTAYDLSNVSENALVLEASAIWREGGDVRFFVPGDPTHVSHSIGDIQGSGTSIEVRAITPDALLDKYGLNDVPLIKMDIEGAELAVIPYMMEKGICPTQILVEFDEILFPSAEAKSKVEAVDRLLREHGYGCYHTDGVSNYLYLRQGVSRF